MRFDQMLALADMAVPSFYQIIILTLSSLMALINLLCCTLETKTLPN